MASLRARMAGFRLVKVMVHEGCQTLMRFPWSSIESAAPGLNDMARCR